jgi:hypothetical protein
MPKIASVMDRTTPDIKGPRHGSAILLLRKIAPRQFGTIHITGSL